MVVTKVSSEHLGHFVRAILSYKPDDICQVSLTRLVKVCPLRSIYGWDSLDLIATTTMDPSGHRGHVHLLNKIDGATGEQETKQSVLSRTIRLSYCLRKYGLKPGDVVALGGRNHLDVHIPFYAAMMSGLPMAGVDLLYKYDELKALFKIIVPKIVFCEPDASEDAKRAALDLGLAPLIVTFRGGEYSMEKFMDEYYDLEPEESFEIPQIDTDKVYAWLVSTSGTTGTPKVVALKHPELLLMAKSSNTMFGCKEIDRSLGCGLNLSSMRWITAYFNALFIPVGLIKVQTSAPSTPKHVAELINKYKPKIMVSTPTTIARVMQTDCDLTCFDNLVLGGSQAHEQLLMGLKKRVRPDTMVTPAYAQTEISAFVLARTPDSPFMSLGKKTSQYQIKLVDLENGEKINEPNVTGELFLKGPMMAGYYNDPEATAAVFTKDGWYKTGDLMYRDENDNFFFVDRLKMLIRYQNYQVIPPEIEEVIASHPEVLEVCVSSVLHPEDSERPAACVVRRPESKISAQEIKDLVASKLSVHQQLYGGVLFVDQLPVTSTGKVARMKVKELLKTALLE